MKMLAVMMSFVLAGGFVAGCGSPCDQYDEIWIEGALQECAMFPECCDCVCLEEEGKIGDSFSDSDDCVCADIRPEPCTDSEEELAEFLLDQFSKDEIMDSAGDDILLICQ